MEVEPLQDSAPNRYAFESDDSEDDIGRNAYPGVSERIKRSKHRYDAEVVWNVNAGALGGGNLFVAVGQAGLAWASGVQLAKSIADIQLDDTKVASVFTIDEHPEDLVLVLKYDLPISAMPSFASKVLTTFTPSRLETRLRGLSRPPLTPHRVTIMDGYSSPAYIASERRNDLDPPIRYLQTACIDEKPTTTTTSKRVKLFRPPNLLLSTSAAFLSILEQGQKTPGLLLLLPFPQIERPPPRTIEPIRVSVSWPERQIVEMNSILLTSIKWDPVLAKDIGRLTVSQSKKKKSDTADLSMYI
ncbi:hypothetical protein FRC17_003947 [Serendipita sp. 399]|nr:hypothetical protein FRC17_003947 [Serendipita sp. 399]